MSAISARKALLVFLLLGLLATGAACGRQMESETSPTWQEQYDLGVRYLSEGNYEEAILAFTAAIEIDPKKADAYLGMAEVYIAQGNTDAAAEVLTNALAVVEDSAIIQARLDELVKQSDAKTESEPEVQPEVALEPKPRPQPELQPAQEPESESKTESEPRLGSEVIPTSNPSSQVLSELESEIQEEQLREESDAVTIEETDSEEVASTQKRLCPVGYYIYEYNKDGKLIKGTWYDDHGDPGQYFLDDEETGHRLFYTTEWELQYECEFSPVGNEKKRTYYKDGMVDYYVESSYYDENTKYSKLKQQDVYGADGTLTNTFYYWP